MPSRLQSMLRLPADFTVPSRLHSMRRSLVPVQEYILEQTQEYLPYIPERVQGYIPEHTQELIQE